jgi:hypothetical protein
MSKHTPGRWFSNENYVFSDNKIIENNPTVVCRAATEYDARLIAAAPDLLYALEEILLHETKLYNDMATVIEAKRAVAKAKGETE